jgi:hypothetical protein
LNFLSLLLSGEGILDALHIVGHRGSYIVS